jgi:4'-phosphopantetheinyl transferase
MSSETDSTERFPLAEGSYSVWFIPSEIELSADCLSLLNDPERDRVARLYHPEDQRSYGTAHASLRLILGSILEIPPQKVEFAVSASGKPGLSHTMACAGLNFSISHTRGASAVAISRAGSIGVDIECYRPIHRPIELAAKLFGSEVALRLASEPSGNRHRRFLEIFTAAEAYLKAADQAVLKRDRLPVRFQMGDVKKGFIREIRSRWQLIGLDLADRYCGAVVLPVSGNHPPNSLTPTIVDLNTLRLTLG